MRTLVALVFVVMLGALLRIQGTSALLWFPVGFVLGLCLTSQMLFPILLGLPRAIKLVWTGQMSAAVFPFLIFAPAFWFTLLFAAGWFWPAAVCYLNRNLAFLLGNSLGFIAIALDPLSKKGRADFLEDFEKAYGRFYADSVLALRQKQETQETTSVAEVQRIFQEILKSSDPGRSERSLLASYHIFDPKVVDLLERLASDLIQEGVHDANEVVDALHRIVSPYFEDDLSKRDVRDAFSGYTASDPEAELLIAEREKERLSAERDRLQNELDGLIKKVEGARHEEHQRFQQAELAYAEAVRLSPNDADAKAALERVRSRLKENER